jgi:hypothetical protein
MHPKWAHLPFLQTEQAAMKVKITRMFVGFEIDALDAVFVFLDPHHLTVFHSRRKPCAAKD